MRAPTLHLAETGVFVPSFTTPPFATGTVAPKLTVQNDAASTEGGSISCTVVGPDGAAVGHAQGAVPSVAGGSLQTVSLPNITVNAPSLWSVQHPSLYTVITTLTTDSGAVDTRNTTVGFRDLTWSHEGGLFVNGKHVKIRGMCDHNDFTAVGMAVSTAQSPAKRQLATLPSRSITRITLPPQATTVSEFWRPLTP